MPPLKAQLLLEESQSAYFPEMVFTDSGITVQLHRNTHSKLFMGKEGHSFQFFGHSGRCIFKIYLGRDEQRQLLPEQVERFMALRRQYQEEVKA